MKICKKCGELTSYNSYFDGYYCTCCGKLEVDPQPKIRIVRSQLRLKKAGNLFYKTSTVISADM